MIHTTISIFHDYHCPILRNSFPPVSYAPVQSDWSPSLSEVPSPPVMSGSGACLPALSLRRESL